MGRAAAGVVPWRVSSVAKLLAALVPSPKLHECRNEGARTVLALEDNDIALSNYVAVAEALEEALKERADPPDEIYLVDTCVDTWGAWRLKLDHAFWPDCDKRWEFSPDDLTDITNGSGAN